MIKLDISHKTQIKYTQLIIDTLTARAKELKASFIKFYETNEKELDNIAVIELTQSSWSDFIFWSTTKDYRGSAFGTAIKNLIDEELVEELAEEDPEFLLSLYVPWIKQVWDTLEEKYKSKNITVMATDDDKAFWLNKNKWITVSDKTYEKLFNVT